MTRCRMVIMLYAYCLPTEWERDPHKNRMRQLIIGKNCLTRKKAKKYSRYVNYALLSCKLFSTLVGTLNKFHKLQPRTKYLRKTLVSM